MGADGGLPGSATRGNVISSDVHTLHHYLSFEPISMGTQKFVRSGELRRALGFPTNASEDNVSRVSNFKPSFPVATEDLKRFKDNVLNTSSKARERSKFFRNSICKLDKYAELNGSKKRQRSPLSNEKVGGSSLLKAVGLPSRHLLDQSAQRLEDRANSAGMNKRFRSTTEIKGDSKSSSLSKDLMSNAKDTNIAKPVGGASLQPEERILRLSTVGEGWDKKMKRSRTIAIVASRSNNNDMKRTMETKVNTDAKLASCDTSVVRLSSRSNDKQEMSSGKPGKITRGKISRAPRTGSLMVVNSSDSQASFESCEGLEQPSTANKVISLGLMQNGHRAENKSQMLGRWGGQRQQKSSRGRRTIVTSPVSNHDEGQPLSLNSGPSVIDGEISLNGNSGSFDSADVRSINGIQHGKIKVENIPSPGRLFELEEISDIEHTAAVKEKDNSELTVKGKGKGGAFVFPTKKNKIFLNENGVDGVRRQGRTVRGLSLSGVPQYEVKIENLSTISRTQNTRHSSEKIRGKFGRPPSRKMSDGRVARNLELSNDHEELLAAAASARKANLLSCSGRFWKKTEPIFCSVSPQDVSHLKQQLSFAKELDDCQSLSCAENNIWGVPTHKKRDDVPCGMKGSDFNEVVDKYESVHAGLNGERNLDSFTSLYQRVLSALIEEDENEGFCNGYEGASVSFQCASDDSHCGSCNYTDTENRERDRFESEAESIVDFQMSRRQSGDRFSCNKSVTSNTTLNASMSDSLYSSGRWLGDDGPSYSDAEFIGGSYQNDQGGAQGVSAFGACFDSQYELQYELMSVDDKLVIELQSIGLYPDALPDLAEGEVIDEDITELKEGLCDQVGKKKDKLVKIDSAVHDDIQRDKRFMEQVAMEQLIQMAYKRRMAYRANNASKTILRKVSKNVAMGFIERTLTRSKAFEDTGRSCFSDLALQNVLFAAPQGTDAGNIVTSAYIGNGVPKDLNTLKADSIPQSMPDSCVVDVGGGCTDSAQAASHLSDDCFPKLESSSHKSKSGLLPDDVTPCGSSLIGGPKGKATKSHRDNNKVTRMTNAVRQNPSVGNFKSEEKQRAKTKQKPSANRSSPSSIQQPVPGNKRSEEMWLPSSFDDIKDASVYSEEPDFDSIVQNETDVPVDLDWFKDLPEGDYECLDIPLDDLSSVL